MGSATTRGVNGTSISFYDETYEQEPIGLGLRVPMLVISPWSKGGRVSSRLSDHTSVIRFLETWLTVKGRDANSVKCTNISEWRRAVFGDLTETIGLNAGFSVTNFEKSSAGCNGPYSVLAPYPYSDKDKFAPAIAAQDRKACPLPYNYEVVATRMVRQLPSHLITRNHPQRRHLSFTLMHRRPRRKHSTTLWPHTASTVFPLR